MRRMAAGVALITVALSGCTTLRTNTEHDPDVDFTRFATFSWACDDSPVRSSVEADRYVSPLDLARIESAIETELVAKGLEQVDVGMPADLRVAYTVGARDRVDVDRDPTIYAGRWARWPYVGDGVTVDTYTEGMLAIDLFDAESMRPVWHGVARKRVTRSDTEDSAPIIKEVVAAILADYPPP